MGVGVCMLHQWVELVREGRNDGRSEEDSRSLTGIESRCAARQRGMGPLWTRVEAVSVCEERTDGSHVWRLK